MHGEYKVPGGKLVVVDLEARDGVLADVRVAGDFFLEPDEAILAIDRALEGAPADTDASGLAARIDAALPPGTEMYGLTTEGIGVAVRRALAHATDWTDYDWQLVHEPPRSPALHMALDEVLTAEVAAGRRPPTLRVWEWGAPAVVIGSFQSLRNEVDPAAAERHGIEVREEAGGPAAAADGPAARGGHRADDRLVPEPVRADGGRGDGPGDGAGGGVGGVEVRDGGVDGTGPVGSVRSAGRHGSGEPLPDVLRLGRRRDHARRSDLVG